MSRKRDIARVKFTRAALRLRRRANTRPPPSVSCARHGVAEFADAQLRAAPSDRFARSLLDEKGEFAFGAMFASLLRCRFALWKWRSLWT